MFALYLHKNFTVYVGYFCTPPFTFLQNAKTRRAERAPGVNMLLPVSIPGKIRRRVRAA